MSIDDFFNGIHVDASYVDSAAIARNKRIEFLMLDENQTLKIVAIYAACTGIRTGIVTERFGC